MNNQEVKSLYDLSTIRERANLIYKLGLEGKLKFFNINEDVIDDAAKLVADTTKSNYPNLDVPYHSRWRHFEVVEGSLYKEILQVLSGLNRNESLKRKVELVFISSLLDAGAGSTWQYELDGKIYSRSEGLAVATMKMYLDGQMSSVNDPCGIGGKGLLSISESEFCASFQVTDSNPLVGVKNRVSIMHSIGKALQDTKHDSLFDAIFPDIELDATQVSMNNIFQDLLMFLVPLLPESKKVNNISLGDVGNHQSLCSDNNPLGLIPFHKLSQWICYSLIEPFTDGGLEVVDVDSLTGLPEYRNGGLFSDIGVLTLKEPSDASKAWKLSSEFIVEWRALTVVLLDITRLKVAKLLGKDLSMGMLLQGGTWSAGRGLAAKKREDLSGPYILDSQGTIF
jgi:hypothetical protein